MKPISIHAINRILDYESLRTGVEDHLCCNKCQENKEDKLLAKFGQFLLSEMNYEQPKRMDKIVQKFQK